MVLGSCVHIHVVDTNTGASDNLEIFGGCENGRRDLGLATDHQAVEFGNDLDQFLLLEACLHHDLDNTSLSKGFHSTLGNRVCDENFWDAAHDEMVINCCWFDPSGASLDKRLRND